MTQQGKGRAEYCQHQAGLCRLYAREIPGAEKHYTELAAYYDREAERALNHGNA